MPISVADIFRPQPLDGTQLILGGAQNVLQAAIGAAVQSGRDAANLRASQEKEFLAERERQVQLDQRRVENLQQQKNTDRAFTENMLRDRRDFGFEVSKDQRDFEYQKEVDARRLALESLRVGSSVGIQEEELKLKKEEIRLMKEKQDADAMAAEGKIAASKDYLTKRADNILESTTPKGFIQRLFSGDIFGGDSSPAPRSLVDLGTELSGVAKLLGDPNLAAKADELKIRGQKQLDEISNAKKAKTGKVTGKDVPLAERISKLEQQIQAWKITEAELDKSGKVLTGSEQQKKNQAILELEDLKKKLGGDTQQQNTTQDPVDLARKYLDSVRK